MATSNPYGTGRFRINVNRVKSKKWTNADKVDYGGGWGDDDSDDGYDEPAPVSADNPRHPAWNAPSVHPSNRSFTNPSPSRGGQRPSFDRDDERRHFSSAGNFDSPYPTTQKSPFAEPQHDDAPPAQNYGMHPALRLNTQGQGVMPPPGSRPGSRGRQYPQHGDVPMSAPGSFPQQQRGRSDSSNRPQGDIYPYHDGPARPDSRSSNLSHRQFPPRKQSLSQQMPPSDFTQGNHSPAPSQRSFGSGVVATNVSDDRPPPVIIRPADIYKRMAEEQEKARKSQESARPSMDSDLHRPRDPSVGARSTSSDPKDSAISAQAPMEDSDASRRLKPTLDPVPERKSEYGFDNLLNSAGRDDAEPEGLHAERADAGVSRHATNASSVYTDRPDPVSASTLSRNASLEDGIPTNEPPVPTRPGYALPPLGRMSGFGMDASLPNKPAEVSQPSADSVAQDPTQYGSRPDDEPNAHQLRHQPTMGYTSAIHQAFDESQVPLSQSTTASTIDRSNSDSTSAISPIMGRSTQPGPASADVRAAPYVNDSSIGGSRPTSSTTVRANEQPFDNFSPPSGFTPGYRRDVSPPSRDNSPAKKPQEFSSRSMQPQHGSLVNEDTPSPELARGRAPSLHDKPLPMQPQIATTTGNAATPAPVLRTESPPKGTVRDLAGRLESSSGRSSPSNFGNQVALPGLTYNRPQAQARFDSFRPAIPGGWQSFTSAAPDTPGVNTPGPKPMSLTRTQFASNRADSTESIPTARSPASKDGGIAQKAFAAAASAGSALADALAGHRLSEQDRDSSQQPSEEESENEWDQSSSSEDEDEDSEPLAPSRLPDEPDIQSSEHPLGITPMAAAIPLPAATPDLPISVAALTPLSVAASSEPDMPQSTLEYFPAPLRTSRSIEPSRFRPSIPNVITSQETPPENENERLQEEIEKSLTPKSSNLVDEPRVEDRQATVAPDTSSYRAVTGGSPTSQQMPTTSLSVQSTPHIPNSAGQTMQPGLSRNGPQQSIASQDSSVLATPEAASVQQPPRIETALNKTGGSRPHVQPETASSGMPFLQQRFSWETGSSPPTSVTTPHHSTPTANSPDTIRGSVPPVPKTPETPRADFPQSARAQPQLPAQISKTTILPQPPAPGMPTPLSTSLQQPNVSPQTPQFAATSPQTIRNPRPISGEPPTFRAILNLGSPAGRIKAFDDSRQFYAAPNDQLQTWLMAMKTPENSELFATNGRLSSEATENSYSHKPSPRRMLTESARARQMQEDGKKLMATAGRFSGKAGHAAKGLFAKGKEKMRTASSGEKGMRRRSSGRFPEEAEEVSSLAPSLSRNSTYQQGPPLIPLSITPASPLATPDEWLSGRELGGPQTTGLISTLPQGDSHVPSDYQAPSSSTLEHDRSTRRGSTTPTAEGPVVPVTAPSPVVSALDSEQAQQDDDVAPSRSISQLTKPTDRSPLDSPHGAIVGREIDQGGDTDGQSQVTAREGTRGSLIPPPALTDRHDGSTSEAGSSERSLRVPQERRRSVVSDVSSASPSPGPNAQGQHLRRSVSLSPAEETPMATISAVPGEGKSEVVEPDRTTVVTGTALEPLTRPAKTESVPEQQHLLQDTRTTDVSRPIGDFVEPLDHSAQVKQQPAQHAIPSTNQDDPYQHRPFSFAGIEGVGALHQPVSEQDFGRVPSQPMSPVSQARSSVALSPEMSQVSAETNLQPAPVPAQRQSRSYSRPFSVDPNVGNHPALRSNEPDQPPVDRAQMYSSESPLPSARRQYDGVDRTRPYREQQQQQPQPAMPHQPRPYEAGYRIPGPYVQEYRSPKRVSSPKNGRSQAQVEASGMPPARTPRSQNRADQSSPSPEAGRDSYMALGQLRSPAQQQAPDYMDGQNTFTEYDMKPEEFRVYAEEQQRQQQRQSMGPPALPTQQQIPKPQTPVQVPSAPSPAPQAPIEKKRSTFGKLFGGNSSKGVKLPKQDREVERPDMPRKRSSMLQRTESASSNQSIRHGAQDQLGQVPTSNIPSHSARRHSRDVLKATTPEPGDRVPEAKKKRFSGFGGKLFKGSSGPRAATAPMAPIQTTGSEHQRTGERIKSPEPQYPQNPRVTSPEPYSAHTPSGQYPAGPGSYFPGGQDQLSRPQSTNVQVPYAQQYPAPTAAYQQQRQPRPGSCDYSQQTPVTPNQQRGSGLYSSGVYMNSNHSRPSDLRIDTSNPARGQYNVPATAPAQVQPPRPTSSVGASQTSSSSQGTRTTTGPTSASSRPQQNTSQPRQDPRSHVLDLHKRSRSPRLGRTASDDFDAARRQQPSTNNTLGTFTSKNISPVGGVRRSENDQERPFAINLPSLDEDESSRCKKNDLRERLSVGAQRSDTSVSIESGSAGRRVRQTGPPRSHNDANGNLERNVSVLEGYNNVPSSPREARRESARDRSTPGMIAELPGSRADGYESDEEISMSATAYPGQEWMPVFVGDGRWDD